MIVKEFPQRKNSSVIHNQVFPQKKVWIHFPRIFCRSSIDYWRVLKKVCFAWPPVFFGLAASRLGSVKAFPKGDRPLQTRLVHRIVR
jgi:hypothetical protein